MTSPLTKKQWEASVAEMWSASVKATCQDLIDEAVKAEREACWNIIFDYAGRDDITPEDESLLKHLADLIRARGQA
jgi:hypothetical protein